MTQLLTEALGPEQIVLEDAPHSDPGAGKVRVLVFSATATALLDELMQNFPALNFDVQKYFIHMPRL